MIFALAGCGGNSAAQSPVPTLTVTEESQTLKVFFLNVGDGDGALISIPGGYWVMIDVGPKNGFAEIGRQFMKHGIKNLSAVFLTHGHSDHIGGLDKVLSFAGCDNIYTNGDAMSEGQITDAANRGVSVKQLKAEDVINIGEATFTVLGPRGDYQEENDRSLAIMLQYKDTKILFCADQLFAAERDLLKLGSAIDADVIKIAHHGESDTTTPEFIKAVSPYYAIISTDAAHPPAQQVLDTIAAEGSKPFVTGNSGTILLESDGSGISVAPLPVPDTLPPDVRVEAKDSSAEYVTIVNRSNETVDLTGWSITSEKGNDIFFFPAGTSLAPEEKVKVLSGDAVGTEQGIIWSTEKIWGKKDVCVLYDSCGREVSRL